MTTAARTPETRPTGMERTTARRAARIAPLALILIALSACASSDQKPQELTRRGQADLQRAIPMTGMP